MPVDIVKVALCLSAHCAVLYMPALQLAKLGQKEWYMKYNPTASCIAL